MSDYVMVKLPREDAQEMADTVCSTSDGHMRIAEACREALASPSDDGWQPIDSAPKDGTFVLLAWANEFGWHQAVGEWTLRGGWVGGDEPDWWSGTNGVPQPTHWRDLPSPPQQNLTEQAESLDNRRSHPYVTDSQSDLYSSGPPQQNPEKPYTPSTDEGVHFCPDHGAHGTLLKTCPDCTPEPAGADPTPIGESASTAPRFEPVKDPLGGWHMRDNADGDLIFVGDASHARNGAKYFAAKCNELAADRLHDEIDTPPAVVANPYCNPDTACLTGTDGIERTNARTETPAPVDGEAARPWRTGDRITYDPGDGHLKVVVDIRDRYQANVANVARRAAHAAGFAAGEEKSNGKLSDAYALGHAAGEKKGFAAGQKQEAAHFASLGDGSDCDSVLGKLELLRAALIRSADRHHRTIVGSKKHDSENRDWTDCDCGSCEAAKLALSGTAPASCVDGSAGALRQNIAALMNNYGWMEKDIQDEVDYALDHRDTERYPAPKQDRRDCKENLSSSESPTSLDLVAAARSVVADALPGLGNYEVPAREFKRLAAALENTPQPTPAEINLRRQDDGEIGVYFDHRFVGIAGNEPQPVSGDVLTAEDLEHWSAYALQQMVYVNRTLQEMPDDDPLRPHIAHALKVATGRYERLAATLKSSPEAVVLEGSVRHGPGNYFHFDDHGLYDALKQAGLPTTKRGQYQDDFGPVRITITPIDQEAAALKSSPEGSERVVLEATAVECPGCRVKGEWIDGFVCVDADVLPLELPGGFPLGPVRITITPIDQEAESDGG